MRGKGHAEKTKGVFLDTDEGYWGSLDGLVKERENTAKPEELTSWGPQKKRQN